MNWGYHLGGQPPYIHEGDAKQSQTWESHGMSQESHGTIVGVLLLKRKIIERKWKLGDIIWDLPEPNDVMWESGLTGVAF